MNIVGRLVPIQWNFFWNWNFKHLCGLFLSYRRNVHFLETHNAKLACTNAIKNECNWFLHGLVTAGQRCRSLWVQPFLSRWQMFEECSWEPTPWNTLEITCRAPTFIQKEAKQNRAAITGFFSGILPTTRVIRHPGVTSTTDRPPRDDGKALEN